MKFKKTLKIVLILLTFFKIKVFSNDNIYSNINVMDLKYYGFIFNINSNGVGLEYLNQIKNKSHLLWSIRISELKAEKEVKQVYNSYINDIKKNKNYFYGKDNDIYYIDILMYKKIQIFKKILELPYFICFKTGLGISIAVSKPIYYNILYDKYNNPYYKVENNLNYDIEPYNSTNNILGESEWILGIDEVNIIPGIKISESIQLLNLNKQFIQELSISFSYTYYINKIELMGNKSNSHNQFNVSLGLGLFFYKKK